MKDLFNGYNLDTFTTDLYFPEYKTGKINNWKIDKLGLGHDYGYHTGVHIVQDMPILLKKISDDPEKWESWMAISPHEIESQEIGCKYAYGHTVIMGLGMAWITINAAMNKNVTKVTVIEIDKSVIELIKLSGVFDNISDEVLSKINIINEDALKWRPTEKVDFLYADIWLKLYEPQALDEVKQMQKNIKADVIYYWGQEFILYQNFKNFFPSEKKLTYELLETIIEEKIKLPLFLPEKINYPELITNVIKNRIARKLPY